MAEAGITVNAVCPGYVLTPGWSSRFPTPRARIGISAGGSRAQRVLLAAQPDEEVRHRPSSFAALTSFLCSDDAASITGAILPVEVAGRRNDFPPSPCTSEPLEHQQTLSTSLLVAAAAPLSKSPGWLVDRTRRPPR